MQVINSIKRFKESIKSGLNIKKVILFGSYARGNYTDNSDIDVCIIAENISNNYLVMLQIAPKVIGIDVSSSVKSMFELLLVIVTFKENYQNL
ncbi:MAG: nucleotidyltransferase domain-containing protein [Candidatus Firestonebacteria bacterium]|nr:nucleotidyltransferase domain-containing protein [Candidatus Firestonebacteria bacterium]